MGQIHSINEASNDYSLLIRHLIEHSITSTESLKGHKNAIILLTKDKYLLHSFLQNQSISWSKKVSVFTIIAANSRDYEYAVIGLGLLVLAGIQNATPGEILFYKRRISEWGRIDSMNNRNDILVKYGMEDVLAEVELLNPAKLKDKTGAITQYTLLRTQGLLTNSIQPLITAWNIINNNQLSTLKDKSKLIAQLITLSRKNNIDLSQIGMAKTLKKIIELMLHGIDEYRDLDSLEQKAIKAIIASSYHQSESRNVA